MAGVSQLDLCDGDGWKKYVKVCAELFSTATKSDHVGIYNTVQMHNCSLGYFEFKSFYHISKCSSNNSSTLNHVNIISQIYNQVTLLHHFAVKLISVSFIIIVACTVDIRRRGLKVFAHVMKITSLLYASSLVILYALGFVATYILQPLPQIPSYYLCYMVYEYDKQDQT